MMSNCRICYCLLDRDDYNQSGGVCGSCIRKINSHEHTFYNEEPNNICEECDAIVPGNWSHCPHCGGGRKFKTKDS